MRTRLLICFGLLSLATTSGLLGASARPAAQTPSQAPKFRSTLNEIMVDVNVRDKKGEPVEGLKAEDFEILENGKPQEIINFQYEKVAPTLKPIVTASTLANSGTGKGDVKVTLGPTKPPAKAAAAAGATPADASPMPTAAVDATASPLTSDEVAGHRVWVLLFDTSSMQPEDIQKAADSAIKWANEKMSTADLVAIAAVSTTLQVVLDFTNDKDKVHAALQGFAVSNGTAAGDVDASTMSTDEATNSQTSATTTTADASTQELDSFNNDVRLRGIKTICDGLLTIQQHKAILYFSSGMARNGSDNAVESRAAENACSRANTSINPVDARGLQVVVAGGSARQGSRGGVAAFSGRGVAQQFSQLAAQQETLQSLAADTGGTAFTDSNDFGAAFDKVEKDISAYYILGYASTNTKLDGSFRKIEVKLKPKLDVKLTAREGYYADRDFANSGKSDRENALQEQLLMSIPATDVPLFVTTGYFRLANADACGNQVGFGGGRGGPAGQGGGAGRGGGAGGPGRPGGPGGGFAPSCYYVPISVAVPGEAVPVSQTNELLDVRGFIRDERGQTFATIKSTINVPPAAKDTIASKQVLFQTGATLPPGRYTTKIIVRENTTGQMGTFETPVVVPDLMRAPVKMSTVILSTQLRSAAGHPKTLSPLVQGDVEIVPNLTHVVNQDQKLYFYYEVYDPTMGTDGAPQVRTNLAFYRNKTKVYETPIIERTALDALDRKAEVFEFAVDGDVFKPGVYTCQVNVIDEVSGTVTYQRFDLAVRPSEKAAK